jgi:hypothetical protein
MIVKNILGLLTFYFFITVADSNNVFSYQKKFIMSIVIYILFILSTKTHYKGWIVMITSLGIIYTLSVIKDQYKEDSKKLKIIENIQKILVTIALISLLVGFFYYLGEKKIEYGSDFKFTTFLLGKSICKNEIPEIKESFINVIKKSIS